MNTGTETLDRITTAAIIDSVKTVHQDMDGVVRVNPDYALDLLLRLGINLWEEEGIIIEPKRNMSEWTKAQVAALIAEHTNGQLTPQHAAQLRANTGIDAHADSQFTVIHN